MPEPNPRWRWVARIGFGLLLVALVLELGDLLARRTDPLPAPPQPNGYTGLLAFASELSLPQGDLAEITPAAIRQTAEANRPALEKTRGILRTPIAVPLSVERGWSEQHQTNVKQLNRLAVTLGLQARAEVLGSDTNAAARSWLDVILLGQGMARGGLLVDGLNALAIETIGMASLRGLVPNLDAATSRSIARELEQNEASRETPARMFQTEKAWSAASFGLVSRVGGLFAGKADQQRQASFLKRYHEAVRRTRRLTLSLAARAFALETGKAAATPADLVPGLLKSVPIDPETGAPMTELPR